MPMICAGCGNDISDPNPRMDRLLAARKPEPDAEKATLIATGALLCWVCYRSYIWNLYDFKQLRAYCGDTLTAG